MMTLDEKIQHVKIIGKGSELANEDDDTISTYLLLAKDRLLNHIYPFEGDRPVEVEPKYETKQIELAVILYNKRGAEGEKQHNENSVNRQYVDEEDFLAKIPRKVGIPL